MHFPTAWLVVGALAAGPIDGALPDFEVPAFTYILPSGFHGWVCVDFGVAGAKALKQAKDGSFVVEASAGRVLATSSFPHKIMPPVPQTVLQKEGSALGPADDDLLLPRRTVGRASSDNPVSRYCLFFGTEAEAGRAKSPPGLDSALEGASGPDTTPAGARGARRESP